MDLGISGKVALITGAAANGLGRAHALALAQEGVNIAVIDIQSCDETVEKIRVLGVKAQGYVCDISQEDAVKQTITEIEKDLGLIEILVNNASILTTVGMFADLDPKKFLRDVEVNFLGAVQVTRVVWSKMLKSKWGRVIFISSFAGTHGGAGQTSYAATKAALIGFGKSLALEGARANVTANIIAPGVMKSDAVQSFIRGDMLDRMNQKIAVRRLGELHEVASLTAWLASKHSSYVTGQVIEVDGGLGLFTF